MRWTVSLTLAALGSFLLYLFAGGAFVDHASPPGSTGPWGGALSPLWKITLSGSLVLIGAVAALVYSGGILFWSREIRPRPGDVKGWSPVLQAAFSLNVLVVAGVLLALSLAVKAGAEVTTVGSLYLVALSLALVGSGLAFALLWLRKSRLLYGSTLCLHLFEAGSLCAVCLLGVGG